MHGQQNIRNCHLCYSCSDTDDWIHI